jgi:NCAIR mutase (PurE)-related protein
MDRHELRELLESFRGGARSLDETVGTLLDGLGHGPVAELGFAHVDLNRPLRCGFPEVVFCQGKTLEAIEAVMQRLADAGHECLATRVSPEQAGALVRRFPSAEHNPLARTLWIARQNRPAAVGRLLIITAGTSDLPVAEEARVTATVLGCEVELVADVGVAGLHRLLRHHERYARADAIVVIAGMEGALASVVGGLVGCPVIAVPTSVGYGAHLHGITPLLAMLSSCAPNVAVVNIDAGFNGGYVGALIARRIGQARQRAPESPHE